MSGAPGWGLRGLVAGYRGFRPDARRFLLVTLVGGAALSLWWIDFNLYLRALGFDEAGIGLIATVASVVSALAAFPASALSDRIGRRLVLVGGTTIGLVAVCGLLVTSEPVLVAALAALFAAGNQANGVVSAPYMTEHSEPEHRSELFALQFAITSATNVVAAALGGIVAGAIAGGLGFAPDGPDTYRVILVFMVVLLTAGIWVALRLTDDRPLLQRRVQILRAGEPAAFPIPPGRARSLAGLGLTIRDRTTFIRLLLPMLLVALGAGQVIPFLNLFIQWRFGLDLAALNGVFAITSVGTMLAILYQPSLARRFGRLRSVVLVQAVSIPFLAVLGFSPVLWTVIAAMAVRNSLMNAGNPILNAFAMDRVSPAERATLSAGMSLVWSAGWVVAGTYYTLVQANLGREAGYTVAFATIIVLYSVATALLWVWFRDAEAPAPAAEAPARAAD